MQTISRTLPINTLVRVLPQDCLGVIVGKDYKTDKYEVLIEDATIVQLPFTQFTIVSLPQTKWWRTR